MTHRQNSSLHLLTRTTSVTAVALVASLVLAGCQSNELIANNQSQSKLGGQGDATVMNKANTIHVAHLADYSWQLQHATDAGNKPVDALNQFKHQVLLQFYQNKNQNQAYQNQLSFGVGCNQMGSRFQLNGNQLLVDNIFSTQMLCEAPLNEAEQLLTKLMQGNSQLSFEQHSDASALLTQTTEAGYSLLWQGTQTAEARYQQAGETVFWQIDHQRQQCPNPDDGLTCLKAREVFYDAKGIKTGFGPWQLIVDPIEGYTHDTGLEQVVRLKRFVVDSVDVKGKQFVYVLDRVVESAVVD